jgi:hypothetical protein
MFGHAYVSMEHDTYIVLPQSNLKVTPMTLLRRFIKSAHKSTQEASTITAPT